MRRDLLGLVRLVVVVPEHGHDRDLHAGREVAREHARLLRQPVVGEVAGHDEDIRPVGDLAEERLQHPLGLLAVVHVAHGGDSDGVARRHMARVVGRALHTERFGPAPSRRTSAVSPDLHSWRANFDHGSDGRPVDARRVRTGHQHLLSAHAARAQRRGRAVSRRWLARLPRVHGDRAQHEGLRPLPPPRATWIGRWRRSRGPATVPSSPSRTGWAKAWRYDDFVDLVFNSGNGVCPVDDALVRPCRRDAGARHSGEDLPREELVVVEGVHHGARAVRRRRHRAHAARTRHHARLGPGARPVRRCTGRYCTRTCCSSTSSIRARSSRSRRR